MIKDELSVNSDENVILRDTRLVIPKITTYSNSEHST